MAYPPPPPGLPTPVNYCNTHRDGLNPPQLITVIHILRDGLPPPPPRAYPPQLITVIHIEMAYPPPPPPRAYPPQLITVIHIEMAYPPQLPAPMAELSNA